MRVWLLVLAFLPAATGLPGQDPAGTAPSGGAATGEPEAPSRNPTLDGAIADAGARAAAAEPDPYRISGRLSLSYRGRAGEDDNDEDVYGYLSVDGGREDVDDLTFHLHGRATFDLDGDENDGSNPFFSLNDIDGDRLDAHLYEAFVDLRRSLSPEFLGIERVRLGRQEIHLDWSYLLDGVRLDFARIEGAADLGISVFGGIPEHLFESSRGGDWLAGIDLDLRPADRTRIEARYAHVEDRARWTDGQEGDDYAELVVRQGLGEEATLTAEWTTVDAATRDVSARLAWDVSDADLAIDLSWRWENDVEHEFTTAFDPYFGVLGPSYEHHTADARVSKFLGKHFAVEAGGSVRLLAHDRDEGPFNREYGRADLTLSTRKWPHDDLDLAVTGEWWEGGEDDSLAAGFEAVWRASGSLRFTAGLDYALYKYDFFLVDEREDATTLYLKTRWQISEPFRFDGRYEFETGDEGEFHTVWLTMTWIF